MYTCCGDLKPQRGIESPALYQNINQCYERTSCIDNKQKDLISKLRSYMENLEVWEEK